MPATTEAAGNELERVGSRRCFVQVVFGSGLTGTQHVRNVRGRCKKAMSLTIVPLAGVGCRADGASVTCQRTA